MQKFKPEILVGLLWLALSSMFLFSTVCVFAQSPFSICSNGRVFTDPTYVVRIIDAGAHVCRVDLSFPSVRKPNASPTNWNWSSFEKIRTMSTQYPKLEWLPILGYGATWAEDPKYSGIPGFIGAPQKGINIMPPESPDNLYGNYVFETVSRYKDCIHLWESWNEPDLPNFHYFKGNGKEFLPYQKACYMAAKHADPTCTVLFAGLCYANIEGYLNAHHLNPPTIAPMKSSFFEEYLQAVVRDPDAKRNNYYFDALSQHSYSRATDIADYCQIQKKLMRSYLGLEKPIWFTETGFTDKPGVFGGTPEDYCDYILQTYCWGMLSGVQKNFHFQLDNSNGHGLYTGSLGEPKPALRAYKLLSHEIGNAQFVAQLHGRAGVGFLDGNSPFQPSWTTGYNAFELKSTDGSRRFLIAFTDTSKAIDIRLPAKKGSAILVDRLGNEKPIQAVNGCYQLHLAGATNVAGFPTLPDPRCKALGLPEHLVGGATQVIIE